MMKGVHDLFMKFAQPKEQADSITNFVTIEEIQTAAFLIAEAERHLRAKNFDADREPEKPTDLNTKACRPQLSKSRPQSLPPWLRP